MTRTIWAIVDDMFFASKIRGTAEALSIGISFPRTMEVIREKLRNEKPDLVIIDLHNQRVDPLNVVKELKAHQQTITVMGFFSHVETELQRNALAAGFDTVIPRSVFARDLAEILKG